MSSKGLIFVVFSQVCPPTSQGLWTGKTSAVFDSGSFSGQSPARSSQAAGEELSLTTPRPYAQFLCSGRASFILSWDDCEQIFQIMLKPACLGSKIQYINRSFARVAELADALG